jgi:hypothetical protein
LLHRTASANLPLTVVHVHFAAGEGPGSAGQAQEAFPFDQLPVVLQLDAINRARALQAVGVSRGWLGLMLQAGITLKLDLSRQRSPAAQSFWRAQLSAAGICVRLQLSGAADAAAPDPGWLFHEASYPGITHLVSCGIARGTMPKLRPVFLHGTPSYAPCHTCLRAGRCKSASACCPGRHLPSPHRASESGPQQ